LESRIIGIRQKKGIAWKWQAMVGAMTKAPLGGEKNRRQSDRPRKNRHQTQFVDRRSYDYYQSRDRRVEKDAPSVR
jgi:hypothetical protein